jgi:succinate dehydrogenase flavin-adding protein (antitoxin of CptAB toxin-antitoxin module)
MKEIDAVLQSFLRAEGAALDADDIRLFERVLEMPDPELFAYLTQRSAPTDPAIAKLVERIRESHRPRA